MTPLPLDNLHASPYKTWGTASEWTELAFWLHKCLRSVRILVLGAKAGRLIV